MRSTRLILPLLALLLAVPAQAAGDAAFTRFLHDFEAKAVAAGVSRATYEKATRGLTPDPSIPKLVTTQPEFETPIWEYIDKRVSDGRIARGRAAMRASAALFERVGARYGVDPAILAAIWGIETDYGAVLDSRLMKPVIRSLATLAFEKRGRVEQDEAELIAALKLVERGPRDAGSLMGSWAGAIGHLQVGPSIILKYGTDGDGDGRIDTEGSLADALATSAEFLKGVGYLPGRDWGYEVKLPDGFDYLLAGRDELRPVRFFVERGVERVAGRQFHDKAEPVFLYVPAGKNGPKFLLTRNYLMLKRYNFSDSYALAVGHLADRLKGSGDFVDDWPRATHLPDLTQRKAIQRALGKLGLYSGPADGRIGPITQKAYARFQAAHGEVADGFVTRESYDELMAATR